MENNKEVPVLLIVFISVFLFFGIMALFTNRLLDKNNVKNILINQELSKMLKDDKSLNEIIEDKKIPIESISYINEEYIDEYLDKSLDRLYDNESTLISKSEITKIIKGSINKYEKEKSVDIYNQIEKDIDEVSNKISEKINNIESINTFNIVNKCSNIYIAFLIISLILLIIMIIKSKRIAFLYGSFILGGVPIFSYYIISKLSIDIIKEIGFIDINNKYLVDLIKDISINICSKIFAIGLALFIAYSVMMIKKLFREYRLLYVYK